VGKKWYLFQIFDQHGSPGGARYPVPGRAPRSFRRDLKGWKAVYHRAPLNEISA
jgi:hypothetical protein